MKALCTSFTAVALALISASTTSFASHIAGFQFEEGTGTVTADSEASVAGNQSGTLVNGATFSSPNISLNSPGNFSLELDGTNDSVQLSNAGDLARNVTAFTISAFINLDAFSTGTSFDSVVFISNGELATRARLTLQIGSGGELALGGRHVDNAGFSRYVSAGGALSLNTTHHIAATVDFSDLTAEVHLYVDGVEVPVTTPGSFTSDAPTSDTPSVDVRIGAQGNGMAEFIDGTVDDVKMWQEELTPAQIAVQAVPEPTSVLLLSAGAVGLLGLRRRRI